MRKALIVLAALAVLWGGAWVAGARALERWVETWFVETAAGGMQAGYDHVGVGGFPLRLDLTVERPRLLDPLTLVGWRAEGVRAGVGAFAPNRVVWTLESPQELVFGPATVGLQAGHLGGEARLDLLGGLPTALRLEARALEMQTPEAWPNEVPAAWRMTLADGSALLRQGDGDALHLTLDLRDAGLQDALWPDAVAVRPDGPVARLAASTTATFDGPPDAGGRMQRLDVEALELVWGAVRLTGAGVLEVTDAGWPEGRIALAAENWQPLVALAAALHLVEPEIAPTFLRIFETLEEAGETEGLLEVPLIFHGGRLSFGPLPLGLAPMMAPPRG